MNRRFLRFAGMDALSESQPKESFPPKRRTRRKESRPVSAKEKLIVAWVCLQLSLAVWAMALTYDWSIILFAALSLVGLIIALFPQQVDLRWQDSEQSSSASWDRLRRFPLFWAGLLLFAYMLIQGFNPAYGYLEEPESWKAFPIDHIKWLPSSVAGPFYKLNPWKMLIILGGAWGFLCYVFIGLQRRKSIAFVLWFLFATALAFCVLALIQKQLDAKNVYWTFEVYPNFFGSVPYKNRGATILYLMMGCSMALYFYLVRRMHERGDKSGPHLIVLLGILIQYGTLWSSFSRGGIAVGTTMLIVFVVLLIGSNIGQGLSPIFKILGLVFLLTVGVVGVSVVQKLPDFERTISHFKTTENDISSGYWNTRGPTTKISIDMFKDRKWYGWGAGSWRFIFPYYQLNYPEITHNRWGEFLIWEDAHNDWAQYASEFGIVGLPILITFVFWPVGYLLFRIRSSRLTQIVLMTTFVGLIAHSAIELLLQNQAVLSFGGFLIVALFNLPWSKSQYTS